jgi:hypothetical protein
VFSAWLATIRFFGLIHTAIARRRESYEPRKMRNLVKAKSSLGGNRKFSASPDLHQEEALVYRGNL